ncbi:transmembrane protein-like [Tropilaelaps mercedesae]|uniref:Transmembrane protein-like n=1 Tax=Tropilaelaps mercedesae TaxID=418985 RepID=A0A1V9XE21_9ACAR|nr:transmembrane protein-like [Tropilaelaps mercedesae]
MGFGNPRKYWQLDPARAQGGQSRDVPAVAFQSSLTKTWDPLSSHRK